MHAAWKDDDFLFNIPTVEILKNASEHFVESKETLIPLTQSLWPCPPIRAMQQMEVLVSLLIK